MIGPGTGIAPFRGFLQERAALRERGQLVGPALVFFGCRHPRQDFIYEDELRAFADQGVVRLFACFSRVPGEQKTYVQDAVRRHGAEVWKLIEQGAIVYVCGDATRMAPDVRRAFAAIHREETGAAERTALAWLDRLAAEGRYLVDVWATG
jgi:cytochrome P450/NADPH-cytochrome P450 reductase